MNTDFHIHSSFSGDSESPMEEMIQEGIRRGLTVMCFTEHMDMDYPQVEDGVSFELDTKAYREHFISMKEKYDGKMELLFGVELGLQPHLAERHRRYVKEYPFDFVIGSSHLVYGQDPYYPGFFEGHSEEDSYCKYFESIIENLNAFHDVDVYGHLDYIVRYGPNKDRYYTYQKHKEVIDRILDALLEYNVGLELNMAGLKYGLQNPNPCIDILRQYRKMGGDILSVGSDGHCPAHLAYDFYKVKEILKEAGFLRYTIFRNRKPIYINL